MKFYRFFFVGICDFGNTILEKLKARLLKLSVGDFPVYNNKADKLDNNPFYFLSVVENNPDTASVCLQEEEICLYDEAEGKIREKIEKLSNLTTGLSQYIEINTEYPPIVIYLFDKDTYFDKREIIENLTQITFDAELLNRKYLFFLTNRENKDALDFLKDRFNAIFLQGNESNIHTISKEHNILITLNFLSSIIQSENFNMTYYFNVDYNGKIFIFGATELNLNKTIFSNLALEKAFNKIKENINILKGNYKEITPEERTVFYLEELENEFANQIYEEELYPDVNANIQNIADKIFSETKGWIDKQIANIKGIYNIESKLNRAEELYSVNTFEDLEIDYWEENLNMLDYLGNSELIRSANEIVEETVTDSIEKWDNDFYNNLKEKKFFDNNVCNKGFVIFEYARKIIPFFKVWFKNLENDLKLEEATVREISRQEINYDIENLPHKNSIFSRIVLAAFIFIFLLTLFSTKSNFWFVFPVIGVFYLLTSFSIWFLGYYKKIRSLKNKLNDYLHYQLVLKKNEIRKIQIDLLRRFLIGIATRLQNSLVPRPKFFYYTINQNIILLDELKERDDIFAEKSLNFLEKFFLNLYVFLDDLANFNPEFEETETTSYIEYAIPLRGDNTIEEITNEINSGFDVKEICKTKEYKKLMANFKKENFNDEDFLEFIDMFKNSINNIIDKKLNELIPDLFTFLQRYSDFKINEQIISSMISNLSPTFRTDNNMNIHFDRNNVLIFSSFYNEQLQNLVIPVNRYNVLDKDRIVFSFIREIDFDDIIWE